LSNGQLSDTVCQVLDINPQARQQVDAALAKAIEDFKEWAKANVQRDLPSGDTLAQYVLPADQELAQSVTNAGTKAFRRGSAVLRRSK